MASLDLNQGETRRTALLMEGSALLVRHRAWVLALVLSLLSHGVLLGIFASDAFRGRAFLIGRSSSPVVSLTPMSTSDSAPRANAGVMTASIIAGSAAPLPQTPAAAPGADPKVEKSSRDIRTSEGERLSSDAMHKPGGPLPEVHYYSVEELTVKPQLVSDAGALDPTSIPDVFPLPVLAQILINEQGGVDQVLLGENFLSDVARKYIVDSFSRMQFNPGKLGALPVKSQLRVVVNLDPTVPVN